MKKTTRSRLQQLRGEMSARRRPAPVALTASPSSSRLLAPEPEPEPEPELEPEPEPELEYGRGAGVEATASRRRRRQARDLIEATERRLAARRLQPTSSADLAPGRVALTVQVRTAALF